MKQYIMISGKEYPVVIEDELDNTTEMFINEEKCLLVEDTRVNHWFMSETGLSEEQSKVTVYIDYEKRKATRIKKHWTALAHEKRWYFCHSCGKEPTGYSFPTLIMEGFAVQNLSRLDGVTPICGTCKWEEEEWHQRVTEVNNKFNEVVMGISAGKDIHVMAVLETLDIIKNLPEDDTFGDHEDVFDYVSEHYSVPKMKLALKMSGFNQQLDEDDFVSAFSLGLVAAHLFQKWETGLSDEELEKLLRKHFMKFD